MAQPLDVTIQGMALNDDGLTAFNTVEGLGLNTFGFLWPCAGIWAPASASITTTWISCSPSNPSVEVCSD